MLRPILLSALLATFVLAGCASSSANTVNLTNTNTFEGGDRTIATGTLLTFKNEDANKDHTVTIHWVGDPTTTLKMDKVLKYDETATYTFATAGTYHVWCKYHGQMTSGMHMVVTVQ
jgi:plastocyanin